MKHYYLKPTSFGWRVQVGESPPWKDGRWWKVRQDGCIWAYERPVRYLGTTPPLTLSDFDWWRT